MADRKGRSFTFKTPLATSLKDIKDAITAEVGPNKITVLQHLNSGDYLVELTENKLAEDLIENGFGLNELHVQCNPPPPRILYQRQCYGPSRFEDQALKEALQPYGEIKGDVIRLKYKADHDLAGLENGNRLIRMILHKPSIPYSLKIGDEWCRIIHNNQQPICRECLQLGHSRRKCPTIKCNLCKATGHMLMDCENRFDFPPREPTADHQPTTPEQTQDNPTDTNPPQETSTPQPDPETTPMDNTPTEHHTDIPPTPLDLPNTSTPTPMDSSTSLKRTHLTDSDSDNSAKKPLPRRPRMAPKPIITGTRKKAPPTENH